MKKWITVAVLVVSIVCFTGIAFAGVTQISGVGPFNITKSGSYQLQGNFVTTNANRTAILVTADNVTIDLNGFAIIGPNVCTGVPLVCNNSGTGIGIDANDRQNIKVYNGTVRGMGDIGIRTGYGAIIESVRVVSNGGNGISISGSGTVSGNTATFNGSHGIAVGNNGTGTVSGNTVTFNGGNGITVFVGTVSGNSVTFNGGNGIAVIGGTVSGNTVTGNGDNGIAVGNNGTVSGNTVSGNVGNGLSLGTSTGYVNNVLSNNTGGDVTGGVNLKPNLCSGVLCL